MTEALIALVVFVGGALVAYFKGRKDKDDANEIQEHNEYLATLKRMEKADAPSDSDVQRWLHERGKYRGDL